MRRIIYTMPDGSVQVATPARDGSMIESSPEKLPTPVFDEASKLFVMSKYQAPVFREFTDEEYEKRAWLCIPKGATNPRFIEFKELPADRYFRNAWIDIENEVVPDRPKAEDIHRQNLRYVRRIVFLDVDVQFMKALETLIVKLPIPDEDKAPIMAIIYMKNVLRDVTKDPRITEAKTLDDLKAVMPKMIEQNYPKAIEAGMPAILTEKGQS